ncbi:hypothetical protein [Nocardioides caldifontis]|uniref:hypothetical protein n=1 Tax=Nocardioides caldifontis TaxID=2588938 RepID=UPI0011E00209|nr:hypothetical protein [Nocardioides caldifontis]
MAGDHLDVPLEDAALLEEVELISALMIAASESEEKLGEHEIDRLLGLTDHDRTSGATGATGATGAEERPPS